MDRTWVRWMIVVLVLLMALAVAWWMSCVGVMLTSMTVASRMALLALVRMRWMLFMSLVLLSISWMDNDRPRSVRNVNTVRMKGFRCRVVALMICASVIHTTMRVCCRVGMWSNLWARSKVYVDM